MPLPPGPSTNVKWNVTLPLNPSAVLTSATALPISCSPPDPSVSTRPTNLRKWTVTVVRAPVHGLIAVETSSGGRSWFVTALGPSEGPSETGPGLVGDSDCAHPATNQPPTTIATATN